MFIDIEWNQKPGTSDVANREPIQIGIIGADEKLECQILFSKSIRLNNINTLTEETCKVAHVNKKKAMMGKTEEEILQKVRLTFPDYRYIVVWTLGTYEIFHAGMERANIKLPKHTVLVLQDILGFITVDQKKNIGFEIALKRAGIPYESNFLHYARHDVKYRYELFRQILTQYAVPSEKESSVVNSETKIIHSPDCRYVKGKNYETVTNTRRLLFHGYVPCKVCADKQEWRRLQWNVISKKIRHNQTIENMRTLPLTEDNIRLICKRFGMKCNIAPDVIFLQTSVGYWRIYFTGNKVKSVFHANYRYRPATYKKKKKCNEGFHQQMISMDNLYDVVRYIYQHDKHFFQYKKDNVDMLFDRIEQERAMKMREDNGD